MAQLETAQLDFNHPDAQGVPFAPVYGDVYHTQDGAWAQAQAVFLAGNGLPQRWQGRDEFVILETGFGLGNNFLATWAAWRADPQRSRRLVFISVEKHPLQLADLQRAHLSCPQPELAAALCAQWPVATPDLHTLEFEAGQIRLILGLGEVAEVLRQLVASVDAFFLDGFSPARNAAMWAPEVFRSCARLAAPGATAATWSVARAVRDGLVRAGFSVERVEGLGRKRQRLQAQRRLPSASLAQMASRIPPGRRPATTGGSALILGAGLAGALAARALARRGWQVTVLEQSDQAAKAASGNLGGLFHGVVHPNDGPHAQLLRLGSLHTWRLVRDLIEQGLQGQTQGLLRTLSQDPASEAARIDQLAAMRARCGLPSAFVDTLDQEAASQWAGIPRSDAGWAYHQAGWVHPAGLVRAALATPGVQLLTHQSVDHLQRQASTGHWQALDAQGVSLAEAPVLIAACAGDSPRLLAPHADVSAWPLGISRGQVTHVSAALRDAWNIPQPTRPVASGGYVLSLQTSGGPNPNEPVLLCGATRQLNDDDPHVRMEDHLHNLGQLSQLTGWVMPTPDQIQEAVDRGDLGGKVGWRLAAADKMPLVGAVPAALDDPAWTSARELTQARYIPRSPGLYVFTALGSRGLSLAPLLAEVLASLVTGSPQPVPAKLLDAVDPARFLARARR